MPADPEEILRFWFGDGPLSAEVAAERSPIWFMSSPVFDAEVGGRFGDLPERALAGELDAWTGEPRPALARVLVLDQFPRNLFRGSARSFAFDAAALAAALAAIDDGLHRSLHPIEASFLYLPLEHAEDLTMQDRCVALFEDLCSRCDETLRPQLEEYRDYAERHRAVIRRFGRFPHRNAVLGRESTAEETAHLGGGGDTFGAAR